MLRLSALIVLFLFKRPVGAVSSKVRDSDVLTTNNSE